MANIIVLGAGIGGMSAAYELRALLGKEHAITVVGDGVQFSFTPSNPWVAVGWRTPAAIQVEAPVYLAKKGIAFESRRRGAPGAGREPGAPARWPHACPMTTW